MSYTGLVVVERQINRTIADLMTRDPYTLTEAERLAWPAVPIEEIANLGLERSLARVPAVMSLMFDIVHVDPQWERTILKQARRHGAIAMRRRARARARSRRNVAAMR